MLAGVCVGDDAAVLQLQTRLERAKVQAEVAISRNALHNRGFILLATTGALCCCWVNAVG